MIKEGKLQVVKSAPPPMELPVLGKGSPEDVSFIGRTNYVSGLEEKKYVFGIKRADRIRHTYIVGKGGVGKSKLLELLMRQDVAHGKGMCLIDPRGEMVRAMLDFIPESRVHDVCLFDPMDPVSSVRFNPFVGVDTAAQHQFVQGFIEIMKRELGANWTVRAEHVVRLAVLAMLDQPAASVGDLLSLLTKREFRMQACAHMKDEMVRTFWEREYDTWAEKYDAEAVIPLVHRLSSLLSNAQLRAIFTATENKVDVQALMEEGKIILVNLRKEVMGDENASMLGSLFLLKVRLACMARQRLPAWSKKDFYCYIDEFQSVIAESFEQLLADAAKCGLCITMSHQYTGQLSARVLSAVLGNVGTIIVFRVGGEDAEKLETEMTPVFKAKDMINLGLQEFYIKMTIDGETYDPFSAATLKVLPPTHASYAEKIVAASRDSFGVLTS